MMWVGVLHHARNEHSWATGFCEHEPLEEGNEDKPWIIQGSVAHQALTTIMLDKRWLTQQSACHILPLSTRPGLCLELSTNPTNDRQHAIGRDTRCTDGHTTKNRFGCVYTVK